MLLLRRKNQVLVHPYVVLILFEIECQTNLCILEMSGMANIDNLIELYNDLRMEITALKRKLRRYTRVVRNGHVLRMYQRRLEARSIMIRQMLQRLIDERPIQSDDDVFYDAIEL